MARASTKTTQLVMDALPAALIDPGTRNVPEVSGDALIICAGQSYIYRIVQDGKVRRVNVRASKLGVYWIRN